MTTMWIYRPRAADRVFALHAGQYLAGVEYTNGCRHLGGDLTLLTYDTAIPGAWWRDTARAMATAIVVAGEGVAWDEQGIVCLAVPRHAAWRAHRWMADARLGVTPPAGGWDDRATLARLVASGAAYLDAGIEAWEANCETAPAIARQIHHGTETWLSLAGEPEWRSAPWPIAHHYGTWEVARADVREAA